jgi:hypothetical protein
MAAARRSFEHRRGRRILAFVEQDKPPAAGNSAAGQTVFAATGYGLFVSRMAARWARQWLPVNSSIAGLLTDAPRRANLGDYR